jgi:hypothetical protein
MTIDIMISDAIFLSEIHCDTCRLFFAYFMIELPVSGEHGFCLFNTEIANAAAFLRKF